MRDPTRQPDPEKPARDIICVARLQYAKGMDLLLHAWGHMMHAPEEWRAALRPRLLLVGEGPLRSKLERIAAELGIQDSVEFLGAAQRCCRSPTAKLGVCAALPLGRYAQRATRGHGLRVAFRGDARERQ